MLARLSAIALGCAGLASAIYVALRTLRSQTRHKYLWAFISILGVVRFDLVWNTAEVYVSPLSILLFTVAVIPTAESWIISYSIPLGSLIAYRHLRTHEQSEEDSNK